MRYLLLVLMVLSGGIPGAEAAYKKRLVMYGFGYEFVNLGQTELLDCKYGEINVGKGPGSCSVGAAPLADFLYVKWRDRPTGQVYEERVDLKRRLPPPKTIERSIIYWLIEDNQLYVYLIPYGGDSSRPSTRRNRMESNTHTNGPAKYDYLDVKTLYPDNAPPKVHGLTPLMEATRAARRAEHEAQQAAQEKARQEAAVRGECVLIDEVLGICQPDKKRRQQP